MVLKTLPVPGLPQHAAQYVVSAPLEVSSVLAVGIDLTSRHRPAPIWDIWDYENSMATSIIKLFFSNLSRLAKYIYIYILYRPPMVVYVHRLTKKCNSPCWPNVLALAFELIFQKSCAIWAIVIYGQCMLIVYRFYICTYWNLQYITSTRKSK